MEADRFRICACGRIRQSSVSAGLGFSLNLNKSATAYLVCQPIFSNTQILLVVVTLINLQCKTLIPLSSLVTEILPTNTGGCKVWDREGFSRSRDDQNKNKK